MVPCLVVSKRNQEENHHNSTVPMALGRAWVFGLGEKVHKVPSTQQRQGSMDLGDMPQINWISARIWASVSLRAPFLGLPSKPRNLVVTPRDFDTKPILSGCSNSRFWSVRGATRPFHHVVAPLRVRELLAADRGGYN